MIECRRHQSSSTLSVILIVLDVSHVVAVVLTSMNRAKAVTSRHAMNACLFIAQFVRRAWSGVAFRAVSTGRRKCIRGAMPVMGK